MIEDGQKTNQIRQDLDAEFFSMSLLMNILKFFQSRHLLPLLSEQAYTQNLKLDLTQLLNLLQKGA